MNNTQDIISNILEKDIHARCFSLLKEWISSLDKSELVEKYVLESKIQEFEQQERQIFNKFFGPL